VGNVHISTLFECQPNWWVETSLGSKLQPDDLWISVDVERVFIISKASKELAQVTDLDRPGLLVHREVIRALEERTVRYKSVTEPYI
jgi:hypothetical protein